MGPRSMMKVIRRVLAARGGGAPLRLPTIQGASLVAFGDKEGIAELDYDAAPCDAMVPYYTAVL